MLSEARRQQMLVVVSLLLALCLASSALCLASSALCLAGPMLWPRLPLPFGYMMTVCAVFNTAPQLQIGLYWNSPFFSSISPFTRLHGRSLAAAAASARAVHFPRLSACGKVKGCSERPVVDFAPASVRIRRLQLAREP